MKKEINTMTRRAEHCSGTLLHKVRLSFFNKSHKPKFAGEGYGRGRSFLAIRPALLPSASAGVGWRFEESLILSLPAADATREGTEEGCVCRRSCCWIFSQLAFTPATVPGPVAPGKPALGPAFSGGRAGRPRARSARKTCPWAGFQRRAGRKVPDRGGLERFRFPFDGVLL